MTFFLSYVAGMCCCSFLSPADVANLSNVTPWSTEQNLSVFLSAPAANLDTVRFCSPSCGQSDRFCSVLKRIGDTEPPGAAVWPGASAHAQRRRWKLKSVSGVERFHFSAASAFAQRHVINEPLIGCIYCFIVSLYISIYNIVLVEYLNI